ncbi:MAG: MFS transporter [Thermoplasmata archaeon]
MDKPASSPEPAGKGTSDARRQRGVLVVLSMAALMVTYVETMIIPGLPNFESFYTQPLGQIAWILAAYLLVGTAFTPIAGKLGDIYGKKRVLVVILSIYFVAVTFAGFTPNIGAAFGVTRPNQLYLLIAVRAIQGVGMGIFPIAFALIGEEFPRERVATAQGIVAAMFSVGASLGLFGGAAITQAYGWQLTYHTVIPVAALVLILTILLLNESRVRNAVGVDIPGATFLALMIAFFLLALTQGPYWGWTSWNAYRLGGVPLGVPTFLILATVFLLAFVLWELRAAQPIIAFAKLAERNIALSNTAGFLAGTAMFMMFVGLVARAETPSPGGAGLTYFQFGLLSLPTTITSGILAPFVGRSIGRRGPKFPMLIGATLVVIGGSFLAVYNTTIPELVVGPIPIMAGIIMIYIAMINVVVTSSHPKEVGIQTGMNQTFRNLGTAIGPVIASTILTSITTSYFFGRVFLPSATAYEILFGLVAGLGFGAVIVISFLRNYRFTADGVRVELGAGAAGRTGIPVPAKPALEHAKQ